MYSHKRNIILKYYFDEWKYPKVRLFSNGRSIEKTIHRLVAEAFIPNPLGKTEVNHIDGNKLNNQVENLEWVTRSENELHAFRTGLNDRGSYDAGKLKRKVTLVETGQVFDSVHECAKYLGCTHSAVICCAKGKFQTCKGYHIEYV